MNDFYFVCIVQVCVDMGGCVSKPRDEQYSSSGALTEHITSPLVINTILDSTPANNNPRKTSRVHAPNHPTGVSIQFIRNFLSKFKGKKGFASFTTTDVCMKIIKPETLKRKCAYTDLFKSSNDANGKPYTGPATVFVSHA